MHSHRCPRNAMSFPGDQQQPIGTHFTNINYDLCGSVLPEWGNAAGQRENQTPSAICAAFTSACSHSGFPPVSLLTDVLRIRFCHLKAHWGDTPQTFNRVKRGVPWWYIEKQEWGHFQFLPDMCDCCYNGCWKMLKTMEYINSAALPQHWI